MTILTGGRTRRARRCALATSLGLLLAIGCAACAGSAKSASHRPPGPPQRLNGLVLSEVVGGGLVPSDIGFVEALPRVAVFSDGRIFTVDRASTDVFSGPSIVVLRVRRVPAATVNRIVTLAQAARVASRPPDWGAPMVTDQPTTSVTLVTFGHARTVSVYAFGFNGAGLNPQQTAARRRLAAFLNDLEGIGSGRGPGSAVRPYVPVSLSVSARLVDAHPSSTGAAVRWPLQALRLLPADRVQCVGVSGASNVKRVLRLAATASPSTVWVSAGRSWRLIVRPDLPSIQSCGKEP